MDGTRWAAARRQLGIAGGLLVADPGTGLAAETAVLNAEVAFADNDIDLCLRPGRERLRLAAGKSRGRTGDQLQSTELAMTADGELRHYSVWADLARLCAAEPALADGWGQPQQWLMVAAARSPARD